MQSSPTRYVPAADIFFNDGKLGTGDPSAFNFSTLNQKITPAPLIIDTPDKSAMIIPEGIPLPPVATKPFEKPSNQITRSSSSSSRSHSHSRAMLQKESKRRSHSPKHLQRSKSSKSSKKSTDSQGSSKTSQKNKKKYYQHTDQVSQKYAFENLAGLPQREPEPVSRQYPTARVSTVDKVQSSSQRSSKRPSRMRTNETFSGSESDERASTTTSSSLRRDFLHKSGGRSGARDFSGDDLDDLNFFLPEATRRKSRKSYKNEHPRHTSQRKDLYYTQATPISNQSRRQRDKHTSSKKSSRKSPSLYSDTESDRGYSALANMDRVKPPTPQFKSLSEQLLKEANEQKPFRRFEEPLFATSGLATSREIPQPKEIPHRASSKEKQNYISEYDETGRTENFRQDVKRSTKGDFGDQSDDDDSEGGDHEGSTTLSSTSKKNKTSHKSSQRRRSRKRYYTDKYHGGEGDEDYYREKYEPRGSPRYEREPPPRHYEAPESQMHMYDEPQPPYLDIPPHVYKNLTRRAYYLARFEQLKKEGYSHPKYDIKGDEDTGTVIEAVHTLLMMKQRNQHINNARNSYISVINALCKANRMLPKAFQLDLKDFPQHVVSELHNYDDLLEQVWVQKARPYFNNNPLLELIYLTFMSALSFHFTKKMVRDSEKIFRFKGAEKNEEEDEEEEEEEEEEEVGEGNKGGNRYENEKNNSGEEIEDTELTESTYGGSEDEGMGGGDDSVHGESERGESTLENEAQFKEQLDRMGPSLTTTHLAQLVPIHNTNSQPSSILGSNGFRPTTTEPSVVLAHSSANKPKATVMGVIRRSPKRDEGVSPPPVTAQTEINLDEKEKRSLNLIAQMTSSHENSEDEFDEAGGDNINEENDETSFNIQ